MSDNLRAMGVKLTKTRYPGIYRRPTKSGQVYDVCATFRGRQKWECGIRDLESAKEAKARLVRDLRDGAVGKAPTRLTLREFLETRWLPQKQANRPKSYETYRYLISHAIRDLGDTRLASLRNVDVQTWITRLYTERGLKPATCRMALASLRDALNWALRWQLISRNPCQWVQLPQEAARDLPDMTPETLESIIATSKRTAIEMEVYTALATGMRIGELVSLTWGDIDFSLGVANVRRETTKSKSGRRSLLLGTHTATRLQAHRLEQIQRFTREGLSAPAHVFLAPDGQAWNHRALRWRWQQLAAAAGFPGLRFHDLRHLNSTMMARAGVHPSVMQRRLGHAAASLSLEVYTHASLEDQAAAVAAVEKMLGAGEN